MVEVASGGGLFRKIQMRICLMLPGTRDEPFAVYEGINYNVMSM